ncbi:MAG: insulinase family protein [Bdellovibrionales bacterium]|nr:insulinase family protein [Bdellovibrionales bacterium]
MSGSKDRFKKSVLPNGLTVVSEKYSQFRGLSIGVWVKAGTRHETVHEAGVSHFLEHMLFKGTGKRSALDIAQEVDRVGGEFNAFTAREYTCFHVYLMNRDVNLAIDILRDILLDSKFSPEEIERERKVILQEISMVDETPEELAFDIYFEKIFETQAGVHGLGRPILGTVSSIRKMSRKTLMDYFHHHYRPDQLVVSVVGNVSHAGLVKKLGSLTKKNWPGRPENGSRNKVPKGSQGPRGAPGVKFHASDLMKVPPIQPGFWWLKRPTEQVHLIWGVPGPTYQSKDRFAALLLNVYLGGGMSSSLFQEIREKHGLAYTVYSSMAPFQETGIFTVYAATSLKQVPLCLKLIEDCVVKLKKELLTPQELSMIKENLKAGIQLSSDSVESRMISIAKNEIIFGKYFSTGQVCEEIDRVTAEDVRRVARKLLATDDRSILALGPAPEAGFRKRLVAAGMKFLKK